MRTSFRRSVGCAALALLALGLLAAPAPAGNTFKTKVTIEFAPGKRVDAFQGTVSSDKPACVPDRKVVLYRQKNQNSTPKKVGSDLSGANGQWGVEASPNGQFSFAKVRKAEIPPGLCKDDRSKTIEHLP